MLRGEQRKARQEKVVYHASNICRSMIYVLAGTEVFTEN